MSAVTGVSFFLRVCPSKFFHSSVQYHNFFTVVSQHVFYVSVPARFSQLCTSMFFYGCVPCTMFFMGVFQLPCTTFSTGVPSCFLRVCSMHHVFFGCPNMFFFGRPSMFFTGVFHAPRFFTGVPTCFFRVSRHVFLRVCP